MVRHQAVAVQEKRQLPFQLGQEREKLCEVVRRVEDILPIIAASDNVIKTALDLNPCLSCHMSGDVTQFMSNPQTNRRIAGLTPDFPPFGVQGKYHFKEATVTQKIYFRDGKNKLYVRTNKIRITGTFDKKTKTYSYAITNGSDIVASRNLTIKD